MINQPEIRMDWTGFIDETNAELAALRKTMPEAAAGFSSLAKAATANGALDPKTKELIALAIGIDARCDGCIAFHVKALVRLGVTREEIAETVAMTVYMGGGPSLMYGGKALSAYDALSGGETG
jgi:AhpD family alkylhydroperoxidase